MNLRKPCRKRRRDSDDLAIDVDGCRVPGRHRQSSTPARSAGSAGKPSPAATRCAISSNPDAEPVRREAWRRADIAPPQSPLPASVSAWAGSRARFVCSCGSAVRSKSCSLPPSSTRARQASSAAAGGRRPKGGGEDRRDPAGSESPSFPSGIPDLIVSGSSECPGTDRWPGRRRREARRGGRAADGPSPTPPRRQGGKACWASRRSARSRTPL